MKISTCLLALVSLAFAEPPVPSSQYLPSNQYGAPSHTDAIFRPSNQYGAPGQQRPSSSYGAPGGGYEEGPSEPANYQFEYTVQDAASGNDYGHQEQRQGDVAIGKYYVLLPDGRKQIVEYTADNTGYHPKVSYEGGYGGAGAGAGAGGYPSAGAGGYPSGGAGGYPGAGGYQGAAGGYPSGGAGGYQGAGGYRY